MKLIILIIILSSFANAQENIWVKKIGNNIIFGQKKINGKIEFKSDNIKKFCKKAEAYLNMYVKNYEEYECSQNRDITTNLCNIIKKQVDRFSVGDNDFSTNVPLEQSFELEELNPIDFERQKEVIASQYNIPLENVFIAKVRPISNTDWKHTQRENGFFTKLLDISKTDPVILGEEDLVFTGYIKNKYLSCAIINDELSIYKNIMSKEQIVQRFDSKKLINLYQAYLETKTMWSQLKNKNDTIYNLLKLGIQLKENKSLFSHNQDEVSNLEFQFDTFFNYSHDGINSKVNLRKFKDIESFELIAFPAQIFDVEYQLQIEGER